MKKNQAFILLQKNLSNTLSLYKKFLSSTKGSLFLIGIPFLFLFSLAFFELFLLVVKSQNQIALHYRLQVCAITILESERSALHKIIRLQKLMRPLQYAVYVARNAKFFPPIAIPGNITEEAALLALHAHDLARKAIIHEQSLYELAYSACPTTPYSNEASQCVWNPFSFLNFLTKPTLYPDVPPLYYLKSAQKAIACSPLGSPLKQREYLYLKGDVNLETENFNYFYGMEKMI